MQWYMFHSLDECSEIWRLLQVDSTAVETKAVATFPRRRERSPRTI